MTAHHIKAIEHLKKGILALATVVEENLLAAVRALETRDPKLARRIFDADDKVHEMNRLMLERVQAAIRVNPEGVDRYLQYMLVARHLERVGDHATNIAEDVIYMMQGEILRHRVDLY